MLTMSHIWRTELTLLNSKYPTFTFVFPPKFEFTPIFDNQNYIDQRIRKPNTLNVAQRKQSLKRFTYPEVFRTLNVVKRVAFNQMKGSRQVDPRRRRFTARFLVKHSVPTSNSPTVFPITLP